MIRGVCNFCIGVFAFAGGAFAGGVLHFAVGVFAIFADWVLLSQGWGCGFRGGWFWGGIHTFLFEKLHARFAYYKSPELGLNLSGS